MVIFEDGAKWARDRSTSTEPTREPSEEDIAKAIWDYGSPFRYPDCLKIAAKVVAKLRAPSEAKHAD